MLIYGLMWVSCLCPEACSDTSPVANLVVLDLVQLCLSTC